MGMLDTDAGYEKEAWKLGVMDSVSPELLATALLSLIKAHGSRLPMTPHFSQGTWELS